MVSSEEFEKQHPRDRVHGTGRFVKKPKPATPNIDIASVLSDYERSGSGNEDDEQQSYVRVKWVTTIITQFKNKFPGRYQGMTQPAKMKFFSSKETWEEYLSVEAIPTAKIYSKSICKILFSDKIPRGCWEEASLSDSAHTNAKHDGSYYGARYVGGSVPYAQDFFKYDYEQCDGMTGVDVRRVEAPKDVPTCAPFQISQNKTPKSFVRASMRIKWDKHPDGRWLPNADDSIEAFLGIQELSGKRLDYASRKKIDALQGFIEDVRKGILSANILPSVTKVCSKSGYDLSDIAPIDSDIDSLFEYICLPPNQKKGPLNIDVLNYGRHNSIAPIWLSYRPSSERLLSALKKTLEYNEKSTHDTEDVYWRFYDRRLPSTPDTEEELFLLMAMMSPSSCSNVLERHVINRDTHFPLSFESCARLLLDTANQTSQKKGHKFRKHWQEPSYVAAKIVDTYLGSSTSYRCDIGPLSSEIISDIVTYLCEKKPYSFQQVETLEKLAKFSSLSKHHVASSKGSKGLFGDVFSHESGKMLREFYVKERETNLKKAIRDSLQQNYPAILEGDTKQKQVSKIIRRVAS